MSRDNTDALILLYTRACLLDSDCASHVTVGRRDALTPEADAAAPLAQRPLPEVPEPEVPMLEPYSEVKDRLQQQEEEEHVYALVDYPADSLVDANNAAVVDSIKMCQSVDSMIMHRAGASYLGRNDSCYLRKQQLLARKRAKITRIQRVNARKSMDTVIDGGIGV